MNDRKTLQRLNFEFIFNASKISLALLALFWLADSVYSQVSDTKDVIEVKGTGQLKIEGENEYSATFDLGKLPAGKQVSIQLEIVNPLDEDIRYSDVSKRCVCSQFSPKQAVIRKNGRITASLKMKTPSSYRTPTASIPVLLLQNGKPNIRMNLEFELEGLLAFTEVVAIVRFEDGQDKKSIDIPFVSTPPVNAENLQIEHTENLANFDFQIASAENGGIVKADIAGDVLINGDVRGEIFLLDPLTKQKRGMLLIVKDARRSEISPRIIRFRRSEKGLSATALVRLGRTENNSDNELADADQEIVRCQLDGSPLNVSLKKLSDDMYRVQLFVAAENVGKFLDDADKTDSTGRVLEWVIANRKPNRKLKTPFVVEEVSGK